MAGASDNGGWSDNATTIALVYDLFMNVALVANHSMYSGDAKDHGGYNTHCGGGMTGSSCTTFMLEASY